MLLYKICLKIDLFHFVLRGKESSTVHLPELITELSRIGNNINQIARVANSNRNIPDSNVIRVERLMDECYGKLNEFIEYISEPSEEVVQRELANLPETLSEIKNAIQMLSRRIDSKQQN